MRNVSFNTIFVRSQRTIILAPILLISSYLCSANVSTPNALLSKLELDVEVFRPHEKMEESTVMRSRLSCGECIRRIRRSWRQDGIFYTVCSVELLLLALNCIAINESELVSSISCSRLDSNIKHE